MIALYLLGRGDSSFHVRLVGVPLRRRDLTLVFGGPLLDERDEALPYVVFIVGLRQCILDNDGVRKPDDNLVMQRNPYGFVPIFGSY